MNKQILNRIRRKLAIKIEASPNMKCRFVLSPVSKNGFWACFNPLVGYYSISKKASGSVLACPKDCIYNKRMSKKDLLIAKKYIEKYGNKSKGWLHIPEKHYSQLSQMVKINNQSYIIRLFVYFGYLFINDEKIDGYLFCNDYSEMKDLVRFDRWRD